MLLITNRTLGSEWEVKVSITISHYLQFQVQFWWESQAANLPTRRHSRPSRADTGENVPEIFSSSHEFLKTFHVLRCQELTVSNQRLVCNTLRNYNWLAGNISVDLHMVWKLAKDLIGTFSSKSEMPFGLTVGQTKPLTFHLVWGEMLTNYKDWFICTMYK